MGALSRQLGLPAQQARFTSNLDAITAERNALPSVTAESMTQQAEQVYTTILEPQLTKDHERRVAQILEMANKLGVNPAGPLALENENYTKDLAAARTQSQQVALTYAQTLMQTGNARLSAALAVAGLTNPAQYAGALANVFGQPLPEGTPGASPDIIQG